MMPRPEDEFAEALHRAGLRVSGAPVMDGAWHRAAVEGDKGAARSGRYRGYLDGRPAGFVQNFKFGLAEPWVSGREAPSLSAEDWARIARERELRGVERAHDQAHAERRAYAVSRSAAQTQRFLSAHAMIYGHFRPRRHLMSAAQHRRARAEAFRAWRRGICVQIAA